jgi:hypothetical protein
MSAINFQSSSLGLQVSSSDSGSKSGLTPFSASGSSSGSIAGGEQFLLAGFDEESNPVESFGARGNCCKCDKVEVATPPPNNLVATPPNNNLVATPNNNVVATPASAAEAKTDLEIKALLESGGEFTFEFEGEVYTLMEVNGSFKAFNSQGQIVDNEVQINNGLTVDGFVEVGGLSGLEKGDRLYIGTNPNSGEFTFLEATAELDFNDAFVGGQNHLQTLLSDGIAFEPIVITDNTAIIATPNNDKEQNLVVATPPLQDFNPAATPPLSSLAALSTSPVIPTGERTDNIDNS